VNPLPRSARRWATHFYVTLGAIALVEIAAPFVLYAEPGHFWFEDLPAWGSLYGLAACVAIIVVSKILGKVWLVRPENYYDR
jgi:hypothetical protein